MATIHMRISGRERRSSLVVRYSLRLALAWLDGIGKLGYKSWYGPEGTS